MLTSLDKLTIKGFKSIRELNDFELKSLNILIGGNGAGKSNFVEFFRMISAMMKKDGLKEYVAGNADTFLFGGPKQTAAIVVKMAFGQNGYDFELAPTQDGFFLINNEQRHYFPSGTTGNLGSGNFNPGLLIDKNNSGLGAEHGASWYTYNSICSWKMYHFHDTSVESGMRRYHDQGRAETLFMDASNIAPYLNGLKTNHSDVYGEIVNAVRLVIPFFDDFILEPNIHENLRLDWRQKGLKDYPMRPTQLSDGSIRFICLATALLQPKPPSTIIIDEPELGLHPEAIAILAELIQSAANRTQLIVSTQSPALIDYFGVEDVIVVNKKDGASTFERLQEFEALLFSGPEKLAEALHVSRSKIDNIITACGEPENIDDSPETAPSKRLEKLTDGFRKTSTGIAIAKAIGLARIREKCPVFNSWLTTIENLKGASNG